MTLLGGGKRMAQGNGWRSSIVSSVVTAAVILAVGYPAAKARVEAMQQQHTEILERLRKLEGAEAQHAEMLARLRHLEEHHDPH